MLKIVTSDRHRHYTKSAVAYLLCVDFVFYTSVKLLRCRVAVVMGYLQKALTGQVVLLLQ